MNSIGFKPDIAILSRGLHPARVFDLHRSDLPLEDLLQESLSQAEGIDLQRLRRQVSFDRLLARLFSETNAPWLLKGGYAMELRLRSARTTKDIDLSLPGEVGRKGDVLERLQDRAATDMGDYFTFAVGLPQMDLDGAPEGGSRYPVIASLAGRVFTKFHLDVGIGDAVVRPTEVVRGRDWLEFHSARRKMGRANQPGSVEVRKVRLLGDRSACG